jgi:hypothetical protein
MSGSADSMAELPFLITALDRHTRLSARGQKDRYRLICTEPSSIASRRGRHMTEQIENTSDVRFWHKADVDSPCRDVRFQG